MMLKSEILFVDPSVSDIATILGGLRPEVEAIVLDSSRPAARQIAEALRGRRGLDAVHVIAHGAPGGVRFAAGEWSADTLAGDADDLASIGCALGRRRRTEALELPYAARATRAPISSRFWSGRPGLTSPPPPAALAPRPRGADGG